MLTQETGLPIFITGWVHCLMFTSGYEAQSQKLEKEMCGSHVPTINHECNKWNWFVYG
jgi:hypothetical protein